MPELNVMQLGSISRNLLNGVLYKFFPSVYNNSEASQTVEAITLILFECLS
jgi:hypothetical protein